MTDTNTPSNNPNTSAPTEEQNQLRRFRAGFQRVESLIRAVPTKDLEPINLEIPSAVATVIGAFDEIIEFRPQLAAMPDFDVKDVDNLRDYACALGHAHVGNRATEGPVDATAELAAKLVEIRDQFVADGTAAAKRGLVSQPLIDKHRSGISYRMIAFDVLGLVKVFEDKWEQINGKTGITTDELEHAAGLANDLVTAVGRRDQAPPATNGESLLRQQAYTVLVRAYNDVRNALTYLRRKEGDVDSIAPSLWAGRGKRPAEQAPAPTPVAVSEPAFEVDNTSPTNDIPVGFPGSSPLMKK